MVTYNWIQLTFFMSSFLFLFPAVRQLKRARVIEDTPTAKIGNAHQGFVEVKGTTIDKNQLTLHVPMLKIPCVWYRFQAIYEREEGNEEQPTLQESHQRIFITDSTGECAIDPNALKSTPIKK